MNTKQKTAGKSDTATTEKSDSNGLKDNALTKLLAILQNSQQTTAHITLSIGYADTDNSVIHNAIVIKDCPPTTIETIQRYRNEYYMEMVEGVGLVVSAWGDQ